jgi:hypothetical protein
MTQKNQSFPAPRPVNAETLNEGAGEISPPCDYYDSNDKQYLVRNAAGRWLPHDVSSYKRILRARGLKYKIAEGASLSETDAAILDIQDHRDVVYHGPLCGRNAGLIEENGIRALVTEDMRLPEPAKGTWKTIEAVLRGLLVHGEDEQTGTAQIHTYYGWMKSSVEALRAGREQQQQALALCGPADCGKSLLQHILTDMLAGRSAKAERYFNGKTPFNADLFMAEHLILEDNHVSTRISDRQKLGACLKEHCVGVTTSSLHAKGRNAVNLRPWWRVSISLNDDPEAMMILPPLDDHLADKIILLRASRFDFPMPVSSTAEKAAFRRQLSVEIPAFLYWLIFEYEIPAAYADPRRYNVRWFHHPVLKESLESLSPEADLLELIDIVFGGEFRRMEIVRQASVDIEARLRSVNERRTEKILSFRNACGTYLGRLAKKRPERVSYHRTENDRLWIIHPPQNTNQYESGASGCQEMTP